MRWTQRLAMLCVATALCVPLASSREDRTWSFDVEIPFTDATDPFRPDLLRERLVRIAPLVSEVVGDPIPIDGVRIVTRESAVEAERELKESYPHLVDTTRDDYFTTATTLAHGELQIFWMSTLGRYEPETKTIELYPWTFEALAPDDIHALLDIVVAHEVAHVWQHQRFPALEDGPATGTSEAALAWGAVVEGSAEYITRAVAQQLGVMDAFELIATERAKEPGTTLRTTQQSRRDWRVWKYEAGLAFVDAVLAQRDASVAWPLMFEAMPETVWSIEHPQAWLRARVPHVPDLDAWAERFGWCVETKRPRWAFETTWHHHPIGGAGVDARAALLAQKATADGWSRCRGGMLFTHRPARGPLADTSVILRVWRFASAEHAAEAHADLERAFDRLGVRAWAGLDVEDADDTSFSFVQDDEITRTSLVFGEAPLHAHEGAWALRVHEGLLFEAVAWRDGAALALHDVVRTAVVAWTDAAAIDAARNGTSTASNPWHALARLRGAVAETVRVPEEIREPRIRDEFLANMVAKPVGEARVLRWLQAHPKATAGWLAALGPAVGEEGWDTIERPLILPVALRHQSLDVRRFALGAIADGRCALGPWDAPSLRVVAELVRHDDAWVRSAAVRALEKLTKQTPLSPKEIEALATDDAPCVRATLATSRALLDSVENTALETLRQDLHPAVRRAAEAESIDNRSAGERFRDRITDLALRKKEKGARPPGGDRVDRDGAAMLPIQAMLSTMPGGDADAFVARLRRFLQADDPVLRASALLAVCFVDDRRRDFLPDLVRALRGGLTRRSAMPALIKGGLHLNAARERLMEMLEHPWWRSDVLRVMAANQIDLPTSVLDRARAWMASSDVMLRFSAAMLVLKETPHAARAVKILDESWALVPMDWRVQAFMVTVAARPDDPTTLAMRRRALLSPFVQEHNAAFEGGPKRVYDESSLSALLDAMEPAGPRLSAWLFQHFVYRAADLQDDGKERASRLLATRLQRWCDDGHFPRMHLDSAKRLRWSDVERPHELIDAIDRCLLTKNPSPLRHALAMLRVGADEDTLPESPRVRSALDRIYSLQDSPDDLSEFLVGEFLSAAADRPALPREAVHAALLRVAATPPDDMWVNVDQLLEGDGWAAHGLALVPELLQRGTSSSVEVALAIMQAAGAAATPLLPRLRELESRTLLSWRDELAACIEAVENPPADD